MKKPIQIFLIILLACASQLRAEENLPPPFEASYTIFKKGAEVAKMHRSLSRLDNGEYMYRSETNSTGLVSIFYKLHVIEESHWHLRGDRLQPMDYSYQRIKKKKESHKKTVFDWENHQVNSVVNGKKSTLELKPGMTDKLLSLIKSACRRPCASVFSIIAEPNAPKSPAYSASRDFSAVLRRSSIFLYSGPASSSSLITIS